MFAISNLLHVVSGTCRTDDNLSKYYTGGGTFVPLTLGANTIVCGARPQVESGVTLEAGIPPAGAVFRIWGGKSRDVLSETTLRQNDEILEEEKNETYVFSFKGKKR